MASPEGVGAAGKVAAASQEPVRGRTSAGGPWLTGNMVHSGPSIAFLALSL